MSVQFYGLQCSYLVLLIYNTVAEMHIFLSEVDLSRLESRLKSTGKSITCILK